VRNGRRVSNSPYRDLSVNCFHVHLSLKVTRFDSKVVAAEFPKIKTQANHYRKLWMYAGEISRDDSVKSADNRQLAAVFLREITKCKKFYFNFDASSLVNITIFKLLKQYYVLLGAIHFFDTIQIHFFQIG